VDKKKYNRCKHRYVTILLNWLEITKFPKNWMCNIVSFCEFEYKGLYVSSSVSWH